MSRSGRPVVLGRFGRSGGSLTLQGKPVERLVAKAGAPAYLYDGAIMREQYRRLAAVLPAAARIHYSLKANPHPAVAAIFREEGAGAEVASRAELENALAARFAPKDILFAGPGKSDDELAFAVETGIGSINVESAAELDRVVRLARSRESGPPVTIAFRVNLDLFVESATGKVMVGGGRKFGVDDDLLLPLVRRALAEPKLTVEGFHCFAGTQITDTRLLVTVYEAFVDWCVSFAPASGIKRVATLNFGGGLGIPFYDHEVELDLRPLGAALKRIAKRLPDTRLILEPGRYLVGPAGVYVSRIIDLKKSRDQWFVVTDGGIHHALVPIVMNKNYPTALVNKMDSPRRFACTVVGPLCSSADQFSRSMTLPKPELGDLLGVFNSGAYGYTAGMLYFLSHPSPAEVLVDKGRSWLLRAKTAPTYTPAVPL